MTLAVMALYANGTTRLTNIGSWRVKETDRIAAMATELRKVGATVDEADDRLTVHPLPRPRAAAIDTYDDHRMAMSFALAGTKLSGITIRNSECVSKTYPAFFQDLAKLLHS